MNDEDFDDLLHYGTPRHSGRYPWGSGDNPYQNSKNFVGYVRDIRENNPGISDVEIGELLGLNSREFRETRTRANAEIKRHNVVRTMQLKNEGWSNVAIGEHLGIPEATVRSYLKPGVLDKTMRLQNVANALESELTKNDYLDVGVGVEHHLGISREQLKTSIAILKDKGYEVHEIFVPQVTMPGQKTRSLVLTPPGTKKTDIYANLDKIGTLGVYFEDNGRTALNIKPPTSVKSKRIKVVYGDEGGAESDGLIKLRPTAKDLNMGAADYSQVRIAVDGTHYLKGVAVYDNDMPEGTDILFFTKKENTGNKLDAMKPMKTKVTGEIDPDNPFGASIKRQSGALNIIYEEGDWAQWSKNLASQVLSKQSPQLAKQQLSRLSDEKKAELEEISRLTNPVVKRHLLLKFADGVDADAVELQAAAMPRQATHVIIPINSLKAGKPGTNEKPGVPGEIFAPRYNDGEEVVLIRYPHGGIFEIPTLRVNNKNKEARAIIGSDSIDAVGINSEVAKVLSGADFDGDTVLVIPNETTGVSKLKTAPPLEALKDFDPHEQYPYYEGMKVLGKGEATQNAMGSISNLITDMTIKGAPHSEIARAVKHSMVVIDANKHKLDWRRSEQENRIKELKKNYQTGGASTLISRAKSDTYVLDRKERRASQGGPFDPKTGEKVYEPTGKTVWKRHENKKTGEVTWTEEPKKLKTTKLAEARDARTLMSSEIGQPVERVYADHANLLKTLANTARKEYLVTKPRPYSPSARTAYAQEVASLTAKLSDALMHAPLERRAQYIANTVVTAKKLEDPTMDRETEKKVRNQALAAQRLLGGGGKTKVDITPMEWEAIQAGAITTHKLEQILDNTDLDKIRAYATPQERTALSPAQVARASAMLGRDGVTQAQVAQALGVSISTLSKALKEGV